MDTNLWVMQAHFPKWAVVGFQAKEPQKVGFPASHCGPRRHYHDAKAQRLAGYEWFLETSLTE